MIKYKYNDVTFGILLIDDGTLDTVLKLVTVEGVDVPPIVMRFDSEYARTDDGGIKEEALTDIIEDFLMQ